MPAATTIMLAVHCKRTDSVDLKAPILSYIRSTYSDSEAEEAEDDLAGVQSLRAELVTAQGSAQGAQRETLIKYYKALTLIETRFPISSEKGHVKISFPWCDAFRPTKKSSQANIHFEKAAILFNAGAVLSQQALQVERGTTEGITQACKLFQEAAGVFSHLRESEAPKVDVPRPVDLTPEACGLMEKLMLAQAQECVYHKAVADGKSPAVVARLAKQGGLMYGEVAGLFNGVALSSHFEKSWVAHTQMKASLMEVLALVESGKQLQAETKIAKEVATLSEAFTRLQATKKLAAAVSQELADSLRPLEEGLALALTKAQKDNNAIYLEKVPPFCDLPPITGACLVKASPPANLDASSENLFSGLVPESSTKALSKYTDLVDAAVREGLDKLAGATDAARLALRQAELPELLEALDGASPAASLPDALARELGDAAAIGGAAHLRGILAEIGDLRRSVESDLAACATALGVRGRRPWGREGRASMRAAVGGARAPAPVAAPVATSIAAAPRRCSPVFLASLAGTPSTHSLLGNTCTPPDEESAADGAARNEHGDRWSAPLSATLAKGLWEKVSSYRSTLVQAGESDGKVIQRLTDSEAAFAALTPEAAAAKMPRLQAPLMPLGPEDPAMVAARLRRGLEALDTLSSERAGIEEALKELKLKDNILPKLMASPSSAYDALFEREIAKYAPLRDDAARSASRNDEAVAALTRDAQAFRAVFEVTAWRAACEAAAGGVRVTLKEYREVLDHLTEGLRFYMSLQEAVKGHQQQCADFAYTRALQRDELKQELARAARQEREAKAAAAMAYLSVNPPQVGEL
ncbi:MAG: programmed cell death protein 6 interacting protein X [Monoraphidium minutum]|nr:MAG: programmed cell death protein 6 interacting protein X [Monoraphidium minutum]